MGTDRQLDEVFAEMASTSKALQDASVATERVRLRERLTSLRAEAAELRGPRIEGLTDEALAGEIARYRRELDALRAGRLDTSMIGGASGLGGGLDPTATAQHNRTVDEAGGRAGLEGRLASLLDEQRRRS